MKVLIITNMYPEPQRPGWGAFVKSQVDALTQEGVELDVLVIRGGRTKIGYLLAIIRMWLRMRRTRYDLIHAHYGLCGLVAWVQSQCPIVVSFCGDDLYGHSDSKGNVSRTSLFWVWLHRKLARKVDGVIVKSPAMSKLIPDVKAEIIPNGVFMDIFKPLNSTTCRAELGMKENVFYVLFPYAKSRLRKNYPLVEAAIKHLRNNRNMDIEIITVDKVPNAEMAKYMNASNVLVLASFWEGSPNAVKEAMACDTPIVSVDVGDVAKLISGVSGCSIVERDAIAIAEGIKSVLGSYTPGARRAAVIHLDSSVVAHQVISIYKTVVGSSQLIPSL